MTQRKKLTIIISSIVIALMLGIGIYFLLTNKPKADEMTIMTNAKCSNSFKLYTTKPEYNNSDQIWVGLKNTSEKFCDSANYTNQYQIINKDTNKVIYTSTKAKLNLPQGYYQEWRIDSNIVSASQNMNARKTSNGRSGVASGNYAIVMPSLNNLSQNFKVNEFASYEYSLIYQDEKGKELPKDKNGNYNIKVGQYFLIVDQWKLAGKVFYNTPSIMKESMVEISMKDKLINKRSRNFAILYAFSKPGVSYVHYGKKDTSNREWWAPLGTIIVSK